MKLRFVLLHLFWKFALLIVILSVCNLTSCIFNNDNNCVQKLESDIWDQKDFRVDSIINIKSGYKMWYSGADMLYRYRIGFAISKDGINWEKYGSNPVLSPSRDRSWESNGLFEPTVIFGDNEYKMWYVGADAKGINRIGLAISKDGINWEKYGGNPVLSPSQDRSWESNGLFEPTVIFGDNEYKMWYVE